MGMNQAPSKYALRVQKRAIFFIITIAVVIFGYSWLKEYLQDPYDKPSDTRDMIAAVKQTDSGSQLVMLKEDGTETPCPGYEAGKIDKAPVWRPDGNVVAFLSDRGGGAFMVHRWSIGADQQEPRTAGTRSFTSAYFGPFGNEVKDLLVTQGGQVFAVNLRENTSRTVLPPKDAQMAGGGDEGGNVSSFQAKYDKYGTSFKEAKWFGDHSVIVAVMKREEGEVLIVQSRATLKAPDGSERTPDPMPIVAAEKIDFDVSEDGTLVASIFGFQFIDQDNIPNDFIKDGKVTPPFKHGVAWAKLLDLMEKKDNANGYLVLSQDDKIAFARPRIAPGGQELLLLAGRSDNDQFVPSGMVRMPIKENGGAEGSIVKPGVIMAADWHPKGEKIVFIERLNNKSGVYTVSAVGQELKKISDSADFLNAAFSPQTAK